MEQPLLGRYLRPRIDGNRQSKATRNDSLQAKYMNRETGRIGNTL